MLIGGVLGALAGIFFAPKSGKELRSDIKEKGSEVLKDGKEIYSNAGTRAKEIIGEAKHQAKELKKKTCLKSLVIFIFLLIFPALCSRKTAS